MKHLEMMRHPERWPQVILPLKHRTRKEPDGNLGLLGFLCEDPRKREAAPKVYVGCIYFELMGKKAEDLAVEEYADLSAVVAAGWEGT